MIGRLPKLYFDSRSGTLEECKLAIFMLPLRFHNCLKYICIFFNVKFTGSLIFTLCFQDVCIKLQNKECLHRKCSTFICQIVEKDWYIICIHLSNNRLTFIETINVSKNVEQLHKASFALELVVVCRQYHTVSWLQLCADKSQTTRCSDQRQVDVRCHPCMHRSIRRKCYCVHKPNVKNSNWWIIGSGSGDN